MCFGKNQNFNSKVRFYYSNKVQGSQISQYDQKSLKYDKSQLGLYKGTHNII